MARTRQSTRKRSSSKASSHYLSKPAPFNVQPTNKKQQSLNDKLSYLKSIGITGLAAKKMAKSGRKLSKSSKTSNGNKNSFNGSKRGGGGRSNLTRQQREKQIQLPIFIPKNKDVPWHTTNDHDDIYVDLGPSSFTEAKSKAKILPASFYNLSISSMNALNAELHRFASYISLSPTEIHARNSVIQYITDLSHTLWGEKVEIQPFGSFATPEVCTFSSDVDLALWNVVQADHHHHHNINGMDIEVKSRVIENKFDEGNVVMSESSLSKTMQALNHNNNDNNNNSKRIARVNEWKKALEEADLEKERQKEKEEEAQLMTMITTVTESSNTSASSSTKHSGDNNGHDHNDDGDEKEGNGLFVIDYEGIDVHVETSDNENIGNDNDNDNDESSVTCLQSDREPVGENSSTKTGSKRKVNVASSTKVEEKNIQEPLTCPVLHDNISPETRTERGKRWMDELTSNEAKPWMMRKKTARGKNKKDIVTPGVEQTTDEMEFQLDVEGIKELGGDSDNGNSSDDEVQIIEPSKMKQAKIERTSSDEVDEGHASNDDSEESVDKMNAFHRRSHAAELDLPTTTKVFGSHRKTEVIELSSDSDADSNFDDSNSDSDNTFSDEILRRLRSRESRNSSKSNNYESSASSENEDAFELNLSNGGIDYAASAASRATKIIGPTGNTRTKVIKALVLMGKRLWKAPFSQNIHVRKHARVPIICMTTRIGFDCDVALGGHNGTDTSHYVRKLIEKYGKESFATVVLFLKILMQQVDLDKPFHGGLGSYRLYVLVANHFERHKSLGGGTTAAELLMSFFYRYSTPAKSNNKARTHLHESCTISSDGGEADLNPVHVDPIIKLFQLCFQRLMDRLSGYNTKGVGANQSLLASLIDTAQVRRERFTILDKSKSFQRSTTIIPHDHPGKVTPSARVGHTFFKTSPDNGGSTEKKRKLTSAKRSKSKSPPPTSAKTSNQSAKVSARRKLTKESTEKKSQLSETSTSPAKRSRRGALIPKYRPDVEMKAEGVDALVQRGKKNRKNKKKQKRDMAITEFCLKK